MEVALKREDFRNPGSEEIRRRNRAAELQSSSSPWKAGGVEDRVNGHSLRDDKCHRRSFRDSYVHTAARSLAPVYERRCLSPVHAPSVHSKRVRTHYTVSSVGRKKDSSHFTTAKVIRAFRKVSRAKVTRLLAPRPVLQVRLTAERTSTSEAPSVWAARTPPSRSHIPFLKPETSRSKAQTTQCRGTSRTLHFFARCPM